MTDSAVRGLRRARSPELLTLLENGYDGAVSRDLRSLMGLSGSIWCRAVEDLRRPRYCACSSCRAARVAGVVTLLKTPGCVPPLVWPRGTRLPTERARAWPRLEDPTMARVLRRLRRRPRSVDELMRLCGQVGDEFPGGATHRGLIRVAVQRLMRRGYVATGQSIWLGTTRWAP